MRDKIAELSGLTYFYPQGEKPALRNINLTLSEGELLGVVGPSGGGKSSLGYSLSGFIPHFFRGKLTGTQMILGHEVGQMSLGELAGKVGLVVQNPFNQISGARYSVREEIAFGLENLGLPREEMIQRVDAALRQFKLNNLDDRSPFALSGGQQQRLALASIFAMDPNLLILDEPTSQLDPAGTEEVFDALYELSSLEKTTVVLITHKLEWLAEVANRVIVIIDGQIKIDDEPGKVLGDPRLEQWGVGSTQYTQAARLAADQDLIKADPIPITLEQAKGVFS